MSNPESQVRTLFSKLSPKEQEDIRAREAEIGHRVSRDSKSGAEVGYEKILQNGKVWEGDAPGSQLSQKSVGELMKELRWANLGWVYRVCSGLGGLEVCLESTLIQAVDDQVV